MNALGFIETTGLIAAIEAADVMVKSANVSLVKKEYVGKGLVTVVIEGDVGAVSCAIDAGVEAVKTLGNELFAYNVIPSPAQELSIFVNEKEENIEENLGILESISASTKENIISNSEEQISSENKANKKQLISLIEEFYKY